MNIETGPWPVVSWDLVSEPTRNGKDFGMVRLRNAVMMVAMAAGAFGCAHGSGSPGRDYAHWSIFHCSQCDDFPAPAYGPNFSMMPGSYSGPPPESSSSLRTATPTSSNVQPSNAEAVATPSEERVQPEQPTGPAAAGAATPAAPPANP
jgi:hypothetical protein